MDITSHPIRDFTVRITLSSDEARTLQQGLDRSVGLLRDHLGTPQASGWYHDFLAFRSRLGTLIDNTERNT